MKTTNKGVVKALSHLYEIVEAGERGYAVAASSIKNRALKVLFKRRGKHRASGFEGSSTGERVARFTYERALKHKLPDETRSMVQ